MSIGIITGMRAEASIARRFARLVASTGGVAHHGDARADELIAQGATALMSFGIAGGLSDTLPSGALVIATGVVVGDTTIPTDAAWCARLLDGMPGAVSGPVLGGDQIVGRVQEKAELFRSTGALAVDLESGRVARAAATAGLPFAVVRAIADTATSELPPAALIGLGQQGGVALGAVLASLWREPGQLPRLLATARDARAALRALVHGTRELGADLGRA